MSIARLWKEGVGLLTLVGGVDGRRSVDATGDITQRQYNVPRRKRKILKSQEDCTVSSVVEI